MNVFFGGVCLFVFCVLVEWYLVEVCVVFGLWWGLGCDGWVFDVMC